MKTLSQNTKEFLRTSKIVETAFILAFETGKSACRYIDNEDSKNGTAFEDSAKIFTTKEDAISWNEAKGYLAYPIEINFDRFGNVL